MLSYTRFFAFQGLALCAITWCCGCSSSVKFTNTDATTVCSAVQAALAVQTGDTVDVKPNADIKIDDTEGNWGFAEIRIRCRIQDKPGKPVVVSVRAIRQLGWFPPSRRTDIERSILAMSAEHLLRTTSANVAGGAPSNLKSLRPVNIREVEGRHVVVIAGISPADVIRYIQRADPLAFVHGRYQFGEMDESSEDSASYSFADGLFSTSRIDVTYSVRSAGAGTELSVEGTVTYPGPVQPLDHTNAEICLRRAVLALLLDFPGASLSSENAGPSTQPVAKQW